MLTRSGFKRPQIERKRTVHVPIPPEHRRNASMTPASTMQQAIPKDEPVTSEPYRRLVALMDCINCGKQNRSQHAHENDGKGKSMKLDDRRAMPLCCDEPGAEGCHPKFDQYRLIPGGHDAHVKQGLIWAAQTRAAIEASGQWPKNLPKWTA